MVGMFGGSVERLRAKAQTRIAASDEYIGDGEYGRALSENLAAVRFARRLRKIEQGNRRHTAVLGSLYYNQALLCEKTQLALYGITAARMSVGYYEVLDPTVHGTKSIAEAVADTPPIVEGGEPVDAAQLIAHLADARSRLAYLLGTYGASDRHRDRELRRFDRDPNLTLEHEINVLDYKSYFAYRGLADCSRYTEEDANRILEQGGEGLRNYHLRFP